MLFELLRAPELAIDLRATWGNFGATGQTRTGVAPKCRSPTALRETPKPAAKTIRIFDHDGLYLEVSPRDGKWWRLKYRYAGKEKRVSLGVYPEVNLKRAPARTIEARQLLDSGVDPSENRRAAKAAQMDGAANSFEVVAREWIEQQMKTYACAEERGSHHGNEVAAIDRGRAHQACRGSMGQYCS
jgi:hypothetical protein